ncbi:MAG TPA: 3'(2'),5'-bisphosphate nucleotidase CysQ [Methylotenera sp.]|nr:3'(2'),5'-bisphosphate nucleotidase CysQ [Methylotenera sp.]
MSKPDYQQYLEPIIAIAKAAGYAIMQVYSTDFSVVKKEDNSPLTQADVAAHNIIVDALKQLTPDIPSLSEESENIAAEVRQAWPRYWLIDPLDGTREFVKRNGEFTVNIALIENHKPVLGVVFAPVKNLLYFACEGYGAYKQQDNQVKERINIKIFDARKPIVAGSRSHQDQKMHHFIQNIEMNLGIYPELISMGSSLKICLVADGTADVYPRLGPTFEWDTAAGHSILNEAGGDIVDEQGLPLRYNTKSSLLNPYFFATNRSLQWEKFL